MTNFSNDSIPPSQINKMITNNPDLNPKTPNKGMSINHQLVFS